MLDDGFTFFTKINRGKRFGYLHAIPVFILMIGMHGVLHAQETDTSRRKNYEFSSGYIETWKVDENTRGVLLDGGAELQIGNERLTANRIIGWLNTVRAEKGDRIPETAELTRVYAEENVLYWKEEEFLQANRLYLNRKNNTGVARDVTYRSYDNTSNVPLVVRSEYFYQTGQNTYEATGVEFTTCDFAHPDYNINANSIYIWHDRKGDETSISTWHVVPEYRNVPFAYWPYMYGRSAGDQIPIKKVEYGNNDRFGQFIETLWGFQFSSMKRDKEGNVVRDKHDNVVYNYDLDLDVRADYRERRGPALGPELDYEIGRNHEGFFYGYLMNDLKGPNPENDFDQQFLPQEKEHRGRAWWFHRYDLYGMERDIHQLRLDTEINNVSDRHFREEFLEDEFKTGKEPETYTYLRHVNENHFGSFLTRYRLNSFQTQTESLPALNYSVHGETIDETPLVYSSDTSLSNLRRRQSRLSPDDDFRSGRFDTYQEVAVPFSPGPFQARLFSGGRFTKYENDPATNDTLNRHVFSGGAQLFDQLHKTFPVSSDALGLNGLRHIVSWDLRYTNNFEANKAPTTLPRFDTRDPRGEHEEIYLEIRNRFQTRSSPPADEENDPEQSSDKAKGKQKENTHEFLNIGAAIEHYPNEERDRQRIREQNHLAPASWITSVQSPQTGDILDDNFSLLNLDFEFTPKLPLSLSGKYEVNLEAENLDTATTRLGFSLVKDLTVSITHSYIRNLTETIDARLQIPFSDHWNFAGSTSYDLDRREGQDVQIGLGYRLHDFTIRFGAQFDDRRDDEEFTISITPNFTSTNTTIFDQDISEFQ